MATSAFRSTTKRTPIGKTNDDPTASSNRSSAHRRFSRSLPGAEEEFSAATPLRGKFVNTVRGSGFPEISLDDLTVEFFDSGSGLQGRSSDAGAGNGATPASQWRGRSVSRQGSTRVSVTGSDGRGSVGNCSGRGRVVPENDSRRRRSMSVVRYQISDSESDLDSSRKPSSQANSKSLGIANNKMLSSNKPTAPNHKQGLRRSLSQRDFKSNDGYSSQSSTLTDDEGREAYSGNNGNIERTIRALYAQKKAEHPTGIDVNGGLYEAMRKELRNAVEEIKMGLEQTAAKTKAFNSDHLQSNSSNALQVASTLRRNHATKQEQSEKRTQDLLTELVLKEQHDRELTMIVKELRPNLKNNVAEEIQSRPRRSSDRNTMSKQLTKEAEKYFEDFISNLEDTDTSSLDGERSDTSSAVGGIARRPGTETFQSPLVSTSPPIGTDGVVLPWLQWETKTETSPLSCNYNKMEPPECTKTVVWDAAQEATNVQDHSIYSMSSQGSWSPGVVDGPSVKTRDYISSKLREAARYLNANQSLSGLRLDMDDYLKPTSSEEFLLERWCQRERINSGSMVLCNHMLF